MIFDRHFVLCVSSERVADAVPFPPDQIPQWFPPTQPTGPRSGHGFLAHRDPMLMPQPSNLVRDAVLQEECLQVRVELRLL